ncbi:MAG: hypothetical protein KDD66_18555 [Bdellovibrionales bacterium]|nr:hypothetical protein [Bdellovibrionales bacterium]
MKTTKAFTLSIIFSSAFIAAIHLVNPEYSYAANSSADDDALLQYELDMLSLQDRDLIDVNVGPIRVGIKKPYWMIPKRDRTDEQLLDDPDIVDYVECMEANDYDESKCAKEAREARDELRELRRRGIDPLAH